MIDLTIDAPYEESALCGCGDPECLGPADAVIPVVEALAASLPQLQSPILRLVKERNEARELVKKLLYTAHLGECSQDKFDALAEAHKEVFAWKGGAK